MANEFTAIKMHAGTLIMSGLDPASLADSAGVITGRFERGPRVMRAVPVHCRGPVSKQILRIVLSYTNYVNRTVCHRH